MIDLLSGLGTKIQMGTINKLELSRQEQNMLKLFGENGNKNRIKAEGNID